MKLNYIYVIDYKGQSPLFCPSKVSLIYSLVRLISLGFFDFRVSRKPVIDRKKK